MNLNKEDVRRIVEIMLKESLRLQVKGDKVQLLLGQDVISEILIEDLK